MKLYTVGVFLCQLGPLARCEPSCNLRCTLLRNNVNKLEWMEPFLERICKGHNAVLHLRHNSFNIPWIFQHFYFWGKIEQLFRMINVRMLCNISTCLSNVSKVPWWHLGSLCKMASWEKYPSVIETGFFVSVETKI